MTPAETVQSMIGTIRVPAALWVAARDELAMRGQLFENGSLSEPNFVLHHTTILSEASVSKNGSKKGRGGRC